MISYNTYNICMYITHNQHLAIDEASIYSQASTTETDSVASAAVNSLNRIRRVATRHRQNFIDKYSAFISRIEDEYMHPLFGGPEKTVSVLDCFILVVIIVAPLHYCVWRHYHCMTLSSFFRLLRVYMGPVLTTEGQLLMKTYGRQVMMSRYIAVSPYPSVMI